MARQDRQRVNLQDGGAFLLVREDQSAGTVAGRNPPKMGGLNRVVSVGMDLLRPSKKMFFVRSTRRLRWLFTGDFKTAGPWWWCHRHFPSAVNGDGSNRSEAGDEGRGGKIPERKGLRPSQGV